jgi:hypothetical protein
MADENNAASSAVAEAVPDIASFTGEQRAEWLQTGKYPDPTNKEDAEPSDSQEESAGDEPGTDTTTDDGKPNDTQRESKPKRGVETRKQELASDVKELKDLLAERARLRKEVEGAQSVKPADSESAKPIETKTEAPKKPTKPNIDDFQTYDAWEQACEDANDKYLAELSSYKAQEAVRLDREAQKKESSDRAEREEKQKIAKSWQEKVKESKKAHADFEDVAFSTKIPITDSMQKFLVESDIGGEILYNLGQDLDLANSIASMNQFQTWKELTRLELSIPKSTKEAPIPNTITRSNPPPKVVGGYGTTTEDAVAAAQKSGDTRAYINAANDRDLARMRKMRA